jgi:shikimate dehydrogenase
LGILGDERVWKSKSPAMHKAALEKCSLTGYYVPVKLSREDLGPALKGFFAAGWRGLNVTAPHKESVIPHLTDISPEAKAIGAVNTLILSHQGFRGDNTDAPGLAEAYLKDLPPSPALVLGAGGAARAVIAALKSLSFQPCLSARSLVAAAALATEFGCAYLAWEDLGEREPWPLVINATSASSPEETGPDWPSPRLVPGGLMADINYGRTRNVFADLAARCQARFMDGLPMLAAQAKHSFRLWTGRDCPITPFLEALG